VYAFYSLPFCAPSELEMKREDLGPLLKGDRPTKTLYDIRFRGARTCLVASAGVSVCSALELARLSRRPAAHARCSARAEEVNKRSLCKLHLDATESARFKQAIADDYYFEMMLGPPPS